MSYKTIVVEDEPLSRAFLVNLLKEFCPESTVIATASSESEAVSEIEKHRPDLVFLDIELQHGTGFDVLQKTHQYNYHVVFTTAFDHYGIKAIKFSGVDFLQKPIDIEGLQAVIRSIPSAQKAGEGVNAVNYLLRTLSNNNIPEFLMIQTAGDRLYLPVSDLFSIEAVPDAVVINTESGRYLTNTRSLKEFEQLLSEHHFFRLHHSHIVNIKKIEKRTISDSSVMLTDQTIIPVSPKKSAELRTLLA